MEAQSILTTELDPPYGCEGIHSLCQALFLCGILHVVITSDRLRLLENP